MININLTLIVQLGNFLITYYFFSKILLKPGIEFLEQAKAKENKDTIFVVLSNQGEELDREAAKKAGASGYIIKAESIPSDIVKKVEALYKS